MPCASFVFGLGLTRLYRTNDVCDFSCFQNNKPNDFYIFYIFFYFFGCKNTKNLQPEKGNNNHDIIRLKSFSGIH